MGNILQHGINMYKQTMNPKNEPPVFYKETKPSKPRALPSGPKNLPLTPKTTQKTTESKYRRVAKFLILIGSEQAANILAELYPKQVEEITKEIAFVKVVKPEEKDEILAEFHSMFSMLGITKLPGNKSDGKMSDSERFYNFFGSSRGGIETARRFLYAAKGPEKGEKLLNKAIPESKENLFSFLEDFSAEQLSMLLKDETAQTTALLLSRISPALSAGILSKLLPSRKADILKRIAKQREVAPEILEQVSAAVREKARHLAGSSKDIQIDGMQTLAAILKQGDISFSDRLLGEIEEDDPEIGQNLKEKLFTLDDIIAAEDRPIQEKLKTMTEYEIAILIKGRENEFCEKIMSNISAGRRQLIREESEILGAVPKRECDAAVKDFLAWFRVYVGAETEIFVSNEDVFV
jgi:flagellar motor switch protein FliG